MGSGIYVRIGTEDKDLILECSNEEFVDWLRSQSRDAAEEAELYWGILEVQAFRLGLLLGLSQRYGFTVHKIQHEFEAFLRQL